MTSLPKEISDRLSERHIVLVGLMGAGKTNLGRRIAASIGMPFIDTDSEIESAAGCSIEEIFERFGEERTQYSHSNDSG